MNRRQESKNSMLLRVKDFLNANASITSKLPNFAVFFTALLNAIILIEKFSKQQLLDRSGYERNKQLLRDRLIAMTADISRKMQAYAAFINNLILAAETKLLESDLDKFSDIKLRDTAKGLYDIVQTNLTELEPYELSEATQTLFLTAINSFSDAIPEPQLGITDKKQDTSALKSAFADADVAIDNIDKVVEVVRLSEPAFYLGYKTASKIINTGTGSLAVKCQVFDADTGLPIKGAKATFTLLDGGTNGNPVLVKYTAEKGGFYVTSLTPAMYNVTISKNGYVEQVQKIAVSPGEMTEIKIQLKKA